MKKKFRKAIFVIVYSEFKDKINYLILKRKLHWKGWEFPKGGINFFETKKHAVKREIKEETGLKILKIKKFNFKGEYNYDKKYFDRKDFCGQTFSLFSAKVKKGKVKVDKLEHSDYKWVNFKEAMKKLTWNNQRKSLKIVNEWLKNERNKKRL
jgi:8-oxo-dGTP pyrophosphatase MutT (NUDIX family)